MPQVLVASATEVNLVDLAGLVAYRGRASETLQPLWILIEGAVAADLAEQARRQFGAGSRQRAEHAAVRMTGEERFDALAVGVELALQHPQLLAARQGEEASGGGGGRAHMPLCRLFKRPDAFFISLGPE